jgi:putative transposase
MRNTSSGGARRFAPPSVSSPPLELSAMTSGNFVSGNRSVGLNQFHFEWCPKYRINAFEYPNAVHFVEQSLIRTAQMYKIIIHSMHVASDHIHLFVSLPFDLSVSKAFQLFKGRSAHELFAAFPSFRKVFKRGHFWSPGKFCRSVSNVKADVIRRYIEGHQFKELNQSIKEAGKEAAQMRLAAFC